MGDYVVRADVESMFGVTNVEAWADLDNDANATNITNRIDAMILDAEDYVNSKLRGGPYTVPFTGTIPRIIKRCSSQLAGVYLYESRGVDESDADSVEEGRHRLITHRTEAIDTLTQIKKGSIILDVEKTKMHPEMTS